jgi:two-component system, NarL family, sensor kinase
LHDGLGQYLAAAKISVDTLAITRPECESLLGDVEQLLDRAIKETRTLSHLLHPPLLDAAGFASAANWYVEGFGNRSGIAASLRLPEHLGRLPVSVETALFRIMQEALTNVHRHSGSSKVEIQMETDGEFATIAIRDFGKGIPKETLEQFKKSGTNVGVGLAGIRERVKELGGALEIRSTRKGTILKAALPLTDKVKNVFAGPSFSQIYSSLAT